MREKEKVWGGVLRANVLMCWGEHDWGSGLERKGWRGGSRADRGVGVRQGRTTHVYTPTPHADDRRGMTYALHSATPRTALRTALVSLQQSEVYSQFPLQLLCAHRLCLSVCLVYEQTR